MAKKYASDYAQEIGAQLQGNISQIIALRQKARADEAEAQRFALQQKRLDEQEARALRAEARQIAQDAEARDVRAFEKELKLAAEERAKDEAIRAERTADRQDEELKLRIENAEAQRNKTYDETWGIDDAITSSLDLKDINPRDMQALQLTHQQYVDAGIALQQNRGDAALQDDYVRAQNQHKLVRSIVEGRGKANNEVFKSVITGAYGDNLSAGIGVERDRWHQYNLTPKLNNLGEVVVDSDNNPIMVPPSYFIDDDGVLMVGEKEGFNQPWSESPFHDSGNIYSPLIKSPETAFNSADYSSRVAEETFDPRKMGQYTVIDEATQYGTGELNRPAFDEKMTDRVSTDIRQNSHLRRQISFEQYNEDTPKKDYLDSGDLALAEDKYKHGVNKQKINGTRVTDGKFQNGEWVFSVSDNDIENEISDTDAKTDINNYRKAVKNYAQKLYANVEEKVIPLDQRSDIERVRREQERAANAASTGGSSGSDAPTFTSLNVTEVPGAVQTDADGNPVLDANGNPVREAGRPIISFNFPSNETVSVPGELFGYREVDVQGVEINPSTGEVEAFRLAVPQTVQQAALDAATTPAEQRNVRELFDKVRNTRVTADDPNTEIASLFNSITTDIRNTTSGSTRRPTPQARINQAKQEIQVFNYFSQAGTLSVYGIDNISQLTPEILAQMLEEYEAAGQ